jgi:hypothetical protein
MPLRNLLPGEQDWKRDRRGVSAPSRYKTIVNEKAEAQRQVETKLY